MRVAMFIVAWGLAFVLFLGYVLSGWLTDYRKSVVAKQRDDVLDVLSVLLFENDEDARRIHHRASELPTKALLAVIQTLAVDLDGQARARLQELVRTNGLESSILRRVRARRWRVRVQAAQLQYLVTHPDHDRSILLNDKHHMVRARAAESLTADQAVANVEVLLELLDDDALVVRIAAQDAVLIAGTRAVPAVLDRLEQGRDHEVQVLQVAANLPDSRLTSALDSYAMSDDVERRRLTAHALGHGGGVATSDILERLAVDGDAAVRVAAIESLASIRSQRSATVIGRSLRDESWLVRRAAGIALDEIGSPGHMLLRRHLHDDDPFARDMARQMLDSIAARTGLSIIPALDNPLDLADEGLVAGATTDSEAMKRANANVDDEPSSEDSRILVLAGSGSPDSERSSEPPSVGATSTIATVTTPPAIAAPSIDAPLADPLSVDPPSVRAPSVSAPSDGAFVDDGPSMTEPWVISQPTVVVASSASQDTQPINDEAAVELRLDDAFLEALLGPPPEENDS